jgi:predicted nucleotidyltransferase
LSAFGSVLRSDFDLARSNIDLAVEFGRLRHYRPADQYFEFKAALERLVGHPVDLVELKAMADSRLKRVIERTHVAIMSTQSDVYLELALRALERVPRFLAGRSLHVYLGDELCQSAVERQLEDRGSSNATVYANTGIII